MGRHPEVQHQLPQFYNYYPWLAGLLAEAHKKIHKIAPDYYVEDVKIKWGQLRMYITYSSKRVYFETEKDRRIAAVVDWVERESLDV